MMQLTLVHHPKAGSGGHSADALVGALRSAGHEVAYYARKDPRLGEVIARPADAVVLAGGDGTVGKLLHLLVPRGLPIGILPLGTANNLARSLGIHGRVEEIAARWRAGAVRGLDVGVARGAWGERLFVDSTGAGAISQAMMEAKRTEMADGADPLACARSRIRESVIRARPGGLVIAVDGRPLPGDTLLAEATSIALLGPRLPIAPAADPSDGLLDLVYAREGDRAGLAEWLADGSGGQPPLSVVRARSVVFRHAAGALRIGDAVERRAGSGSVEVMRAGLSVLVS